jgi:hypothetical protein
MSMTDNAANIAACNQSLGLLGATEITVGGTTDQNHIYCTTFFDDARDEILANHRWNYAKKRAYIVERSNDPLFGYDKQYSLPDDWIRVWEIEEAPEAEWEVEGDLLLTNEGTAPLSYVVSDSYIVGQFITSDTSGSDLTYEVDTAFTATVEATDIAANCTSQGGDFQILSIEYVYRRTDVDAWPISARQALIINLARMLAPAIKQNEDASLKLQSMLYGGPKTTGYLQIARTIDAQESGIMSVTTRTLLTSRRTRGGYYK